MIFNHQHTNKKNAPVKKVAVDGLEVTLVQIRGFIFAVIHSRKSVKIEIGTGKHSRLQSHPDRWANS